MTSHPISATAKFSVLGDSDDAAVSVDPPNTEAAPARVVSTDISQAEHRHQLSGLDCIPQALYSGMDINNSRVVVDGSKQKQPSDLKQDQDDPASTTNKILLQQWRAVDQGISRSLPIFPVSYGEKVVEWVRAQSMNETTVQLAQALYCGTFPQTEDDDETSESVAPFIGDILSTGGAGSFAESSQSDGVTDVDPVVVLEEMKNVVLQAANDLPSAEVPSVTASRGTARVSQSAPEPLSKVVRGDKRDDDASVIGFVIEQWRAVEEGKLRSFPMEALTPQQLLLFDKAVQASCFASTTLRYMQALYGVTFLPSGEQPPAIKKVLESKSSTSTNNTCCKQESTEVIPEEKPAVLVPMKSSVPMVGSPNAEAAVTSRAVVDASPGQELAALWALVDAGTTRSLPLQDISCWSPASLVTFLDDSSTVNLSPFTTRLLDHIYGFSRHSDLTLREGYAALVAQSVKNNPGGAVEEEGLVGVALLDTSNSSDKENALEAVDEDTAKDSALQHVSCIDSGNRELLQVEAVHDSICEIETVEEGEIRPIISRMTEVESDVSLRVGKGSARPEDIDPKVGSSDVASYTEPTTSNNVTLQQETCKASEQLGIGPAEMLELKSSAHTRKTECCEDDKPDQQVDKKTTITIETLQRAEESQKTVSGIHNDRVGPSLMSACLGVGPVMDEKNVAGTTESSVMDAVVVCPTSTVAPRLSRSNTPILSNRTSDKEPHEGDSAVTNTQLDKLVEEKQTQIDKVLTTQKLSTRAAEPQRPSYSDMAKKLASITKPISATSAQSPTRALGMSDCMPEASSKSRSGKRFVASLSAVVNEGSSVAPTRPAKTLENVDSNIIVLVSSQATHPEVIRQQRIVQDTLSNQGIEHVSVDGAHHDNKVIRNALFDVSGSHEEYPQIFEQGAAGQKLFWGGYDRFVSDSELLGVDLSSIAGIQRKEEPSQTQKHSVKFKGVKKKARSKQANKLAFGDQPTRPVGGRPPLPVAKMSAIKESAKSDITFYGATSFVAKHALDYMMQTSLAIPGVRKVTLAGRNEKKVAALKDRLREKMANLCTIHSKASGKCVFDTFIADSTDKEGLRKMCQKTRVVANFAGPFERHSEYVVAACAEVGADYVDITGEVTWAGNMRTKYGDLAERSGARIISFCGFDSIPSDLSIFGAVDALRKKSGGQNVELLKGTCWHHCFGMANGGTIQTAVDMPLNLGRCLFRWVPFLLDDPLALTHPRIRVDPNRDSLKNQMAWTEWMNQLPSMDSIFGTGFSGPFFMAPVNTKIVHASSVALNYGPAFTYRERYIPVSFTATRGLGLLSIIPVLLVQSAIMFASAVLKFPVLGGVLARVVCPPGTGSSDQSCQQGSVEVYSEVETARDAHGKVDRANCFLRFEGDPGNWATAQCICESALALVLDRQRLPPRSADGFGTPSELLGNVLLRRLKQTSVRPVEVETYVRKGTDPGVNFLCHCS